MDVDDEVDKQVDKDVDEEESEGLEAKPRCAKKVEAAWAGLLAQQKMGDGQRGRQ